MKRSKLKKWVKYAFKILVLVCFMCFLIHLFCAKSNRLEQIQNECDKAKNYTCSYYELRQFEFGK